MDELEVIQGQRIYRQLKAYATHVVAESMEAENTSGEPLEPTFNVEKHVLVYLIVYSAKRTKLKKTVNFHIIANLNVHESDTNCA